MLVRKLRKKKYTYRTVHKFIGGGKPMYRQNHAVQNHVVQGSSIYTYKMYALLFTLVNTLQIL